jgi:hypothetical protein
MAFAHAQSGLRHLGISNEEALLFERLASRVLYADDSSVTLKYTGEDDVVYGYTIHVVGVCVEPSLLALDQSDDAAGRAERLLARFVIRAQSG